MADVFLYGALRHPPLASVVLGHAVTGEPARLAGHAVRQAMEGAVALALAEAGSAVEGLLVRGIGPEGTARLEFYAGGFDAEERVVDTAAGPVPALVFLPWPDLWPAGAPWEMADWRADWGEVATETARDVMALQGTLSAEAVRARYPQMLVRAASRLLARCSAPTALRFQAGPQDVEVRRRHLAYAQFFAVEEYSLRHRKFDGGLSPWLDRATFVMADAVTVLPYDPLRDRVLLVEQFRSGPLARGDAQCWQLEAIAGRIDAAEGPEATARREAKEEAGLDLGELILVARCYPSPGGVTEYLHNYVALCDLPDGTAGTHGLEGEGEDIRTHVIAFDRLMELVASGEVENAPLILVSLWLQRERPRLRGALQG